MQVFGICLIRNKSFVSSISHLIIRSSFNTQKTLEINDKKNEFYYKPSPLINKIDKNKIPLALVLGWTAANTKHVYKFSQIYEQLGYHTIRFSPTTRLILYQTDLHKEYAAKLLNLIKSQANLGNSPIVVHSFSNAGAVMFRHTSELIKENDEHKYLIENLKAIIYDSGPGVKKSYSELVKSTAELVQPSVKFMPLAYLIAYIGFLRYYYLYEHPSRRPNFLDKCFESLRKDSLQIPTLVFCSKADKIIDYDSTLEIFAKRQKYAPNLKIDTVLYKDSRHCMHYLKYRDAYLDKLKRHLADANLPLYENSQ